MTDANTPDQVVVGGVVLAVREGGEWIVRLPSRPTAADLKAVNKVLGATRLRQQKGYVFLDGQPVYEEIQIPKEAR